MTPPEPDARLSEESRALINRELSLEVNLTGKDGMVISWSLANRILNAAREEGRQDERRRTDRIGTHGPGCETWGPRHYECALRALEEARRSPTPSSEVVSVPREPTQTMVMAALKHVPFGWTASDIYRAMIEAAPKGEGDE